MTVWDVRWIGTGIATILLIIAGTKLMHGETEGMGFFAYGLAAWAFSTVPIPAMLEETRRTAQDDDLKDTES